MTTLATRMRALGDPEDFDVEVLNKNENNVTLAPAVSHSNRRI